MSENGPKNGVLWTFSGSFTSPHSNFFIKANEKNSLDKVAVKILFLDTQSTNEFIFHSIPLNLQATN
jgi:hypothetical protein